MILPCTGKAITALLLIVGFPTSVFDGSGGFGSIFSSGSGVAALGGVGVGEPTPGSVTAAAVAAAAVPSGNLLVDWKAHLWTEAAVRKLMAGGVRFFALPGGRGVSTENRRPNADGSTELLVTTVYAARPADFHALVAFHARRAAAAGHTLMLSYEPAHAAAAAASGLTGAVDREAELSVRRILLFERAAHGRPA